MANNILYNRGQLQGSGMLTGGLNMRNNKIMQGWMKNGKIAKVLDRPQEKAEILRDIQAAVKKDGGKLTKDGLRKVFGKYRQGKGKEIDSSEALALSGEFFNKIGEKKYIIAKDEPAASDKKTDTVKKASSLSIKPNNTNQADISGLKAPAGSISSHNQPLNLASNINVPKVASASDYPRENKAVSQDDRSRYWELIRNASKNKAA